AMNTDAKEGLILYTVAYSFATIGIFAVLIKMKDYTFEGFNGFAKTATTTGSNHYYISVITGRYTTDCRVSFKILYAESSNGGW
ncbi:MAG: NADH-quinone oxidoreductase subunit N, partial [Chitinophagaceae bacterium]